MQTRNPWMHTRMKHVVGTVLGALILLAASRCGDPTEPSPTRQPPVSVGDFAERLDAAAASDDPAVRAVAVAAVLRDCRLALDRRRAGAVSTAERRDLDVHEFDALCLALSLDWVHDSEFTGRALDLYRTLAEDTRLSDDERVALLSGISAVLRVQSGWPATQSLLAAERASTSSARHSAASFVLAIELLESDTGDCVEAAQALGSAVFPAGSPLADAVRIARHEIASLVPGQVLPPFSAALPSGGAMEVVPSSLSIPLLVLAVSPDCGACEEIPQEVRELRAEFSPSQLRIVLIICGETDEAEIAATVTAGVAAHRDVETAIARASALNPGLSSKAVEVLGISEFPKALAIDAGGRILANSRRSGIDGVLAAVRRRLHGPADAK